MGRVEGEDVLIVVALGLQGRSEAMVGCYPIVHVIAHDVRVVEVAVTRGVWLAELLPPA